MPSVCRRLPNIIFTQASGRGHFSQTGFWSYGWWTYPKARSFFSANCEDTMKEEMKQTTCREKYLGKVYFVFKDMYPNENIATLDTYTPSSFLSCNSSPTQLPRHSRIQQTRRQCFDHNFFIRCRTGWSWTHWKGDDDTVILDLVLAPDRPWINLCDHDKVLRHLFWANLVMYRVGP